MGPSLSAVGKHEYKAIYGLLAKIWLRVSPLVHASTEWSLLLFLKGIIGIIIVDSSCNPYLESLVSGQAWS